MSGRVGPTRRGRGRGPGSTAGDDGQIMLLTLGFVVVAMLLITVVVSPPGVHLERKRLLALADVLALEGADAVGDDRYYAPGADAEEAGVSADRRVGPASGSRSTCATTRTLRPGGTSSPSCRRRPPTEGRRRCTWAR